MDSIHVSAGQSGVIVASLNVQMKMKLQALEATYKIQI